jgi:predicted PurR-regulated permease PerM
MFFSPEQEIAYIVEESLLLLVAVGSFVLPLNVMHGRLAVEKTRLKSESQDRLKRVLDQLHGAVDNADLSQADQINDLLAAARAEQQVIEQLHTWPWSASVFRGFASALLIPIALIVLSQVVDRLI